MVWKVDKRIPEEMLVNLMTKKANIIKDHLKNSLNQLIIVTNIGPTMATFKFYDLKEEDSLKLCITLSNLGDIDEQIHQLWQQVNFLLQQYCPQCQCHYSNVNNATRYRIIRLGNNIHNYSIKNNFDIIYEYYISAIISCYITCKEM